MCGWFARAISVVLQLVMVHNIMATWVVDEKYRYVWIAVFCVLLVLFNVLNVRKFGEIEYWMTIIKLATIVGIIILGLLLPTGVSTDTRQLAEVKQHKIQASSGNEEQEFLAIPTPGRLYFTSTEDKLTGQSHYLRHRYSSFEGKRVMLEIKKYRHKNEADAEKSLAELVARLKVGFGGPMSHVRVPMSWIQSRYALQARVSSGVQKA